MVGFSSFFSMILVIVGTLQTPVVAQNTVLPIPTSVSMPADQQELKIIRISPEGDSVPRTRQIVIEFNQPVHTMGHVEGHNVGPNDKQVPNFPVVVTPDLKGHWHWISPTTLVCDLDTDQELLQNTSYNITVKAGAMGDQGKVLATDYVHHFTTARADVRYGWFLHWDSISRPVMSVSFNQPVSQETVESHVFLTEVQSKKRYSVRATLSENEEKEKTHNDLTKNTPGLYERWNLSPQDNLPEDTAFSLQTDLSASDRSILHVRTFPQFKVLGVKCTTNKGESVFVTSQTPQKPNQRCNPLLGHALVFNTPVQYSVLKNALKITPEPLSQQSSIPATKDPWGQFPDRDLFDTHTDGTLEQAPSYWIPYSLKANTEHQIGIKARSLSWWEKIKSFFVTIPQTEMTDIFGRPLMTPVDFKIQTDHRKPNFEILHHHVVLEKDVDSEPPLYVNNLEKAAFSYQGITLHNAEISPILNGVFDYNIPQVPNVQFAIPLGVRQMLGGKSGVVYGHLTTTPMVQKEGQSPYIFAQVTPFHVQVKLGHFSTFVWVTDMATGKPVPHARVVVYKNALTTLSQNMAIEATAVTNDEGIAMLPGSHILDPERLYTYVWRDRDPSLVVQVTLGDDIAILPLISDFKMDTWRLSDGNVSEGNSRKYGHMRTWGTTAQGVYRAGDTIQYKIYVRHQNDQTLTPPPQGLYHLEIQDPTGQVVHEEKDLQLNAFGALSGEYTVSEKGAVGWYRFRLKGYMADDPNANGSRTDEKTGEVLHEATFTQFPMRVLISDFTPTPFKVSTHINGHVFQKNQDVDVSLSAHYHAGGAYTQASSHITAMMARRSFVSKNPLTADFVFDVSLAYGNEGEPTSEHVFHQTKSLDMQGEVHVKFPVSSAISYGELVVEGAVQDDRGKSITAQSKADYFRVEQLVGLRQKEWISAVKSPRVIQYVVVDHHGTPIPGAVIDLKIQKSVTTTAKVKGSGNAYLSHSDTAWELISQTQLISQEAGADYTFTPDTSGTYRVEATTKDQKGETHTACIDCYVTGSDYTVWEDDHDLNLKIIPEKKDYKVGETARFLIKNPYPGAKAWITVERFGVMDSFVQTFDGNMPIVEIPIKPDYLPGFYVSILVTAPRVKDDKPLEMGQVDLAKPAIRMGYAQISVKDDYKEMVVTAQTDKNLYKPRETVKVALQAAPKHPREKAEPIELAVIVVDEAVFDLIAGGRHYYDPYAGFYKLDSLDMINYNLLTRLVGRQKFEIKGANPGGDGGVDLSIRSVFKYVSYWNPSVMTDENGQATVEFEAPDQLTGWRVLVLGATPTDCLGVGEANFKVNRDTEIRAVMPNQLKEGDLFQAGFSVMNRTDKPRVLTVNIQAQGPVDGAKTPLTYQQEISVAPHQREIVWMPIQTKILAEFVQEGADIHFTVQAGDQLDADGLTHKITVHPVRYLETVAISGIMSTEEIALPLKIPADIYSDMGGLKVFLSGTMVTNMTGAFEYFKLYPYTCWEQTISKAMMAASYLALKTYLPAEFVWPAAAALPSQILARAHEFQANNGGMAYFKADDRFVDPFLSAYTALSFNHLRHQGYTIPEKTEEKLHRYLDDLLKRQGAKHQGELEYFTAETLATCRAVALAALADHGKVTLQDLERFYPHTKQMDLFGKAYFVQAALKTAGGEKMADELMRHILSSAQETSDQITFVETKHHYDSRILSSAFRTQAVLLETMILFAQTDQDANLIGDKPLKLIKTIMKKPKNIDHWGNTHDNLYAMKALMAYTKAYESTISEPAVSEQTSAEITANVWLDDKKMGQAVMNLSTPPVVLEHLWSASDPGTAPVLKMDRHGVGPLYYTAQLSYAPQSLPTERINRGIEVRRDYSVHREGQWVLWTESMALKRGDLVRIDLYVSVPAPRHFVVLTDPIPGGFEPVNKNLATASQNDIAAEDMPPAQGAWWYQSKNWHRYNPESVYNFYHQELRHDEVRYYADYLSAGEHHLVYTAQVIAEGDFIAPPAMAQEMYNPDVYGKGVVHHLSVKKESPVTAAISSPPPSS